MSASYAQALVYRGEYDRAGPVSQDALSAAESADDPVALVDALRARQLACCAPEGLAERTVLAARMLKAADALGSAWVEMWGRLWRIDTLFEAGQLRLVQRDLTDLGSCLDRLSGPVGRWHYLESAATLALATGRFTDAARLAREGFKLFSDMGHPAAIGGLSVILSQSSLHIGLDQSGLAEMFDLIPAHLRPEAVDTTQGTATIFPALTLTLIRLLQGDRAAAATAYALAGPPQSWTPSPAMRWRPGGTRFRPPSAWAARRTSSSWPAGSSRSAASTSRTAQAPGYTWARSSCSWAWRPRHWGTWTPRRRIFGRRPRSATPTAPAGTPCRPASNSPPPWPAGRLPATWTRPRPRLTPRQARPNSSAWSRSPRGSGNCGPGSRPRRRPVRR